jgi:hypothetical protein
VIALQRHLMRTARLAPPLATAGLVEMMRAARPEMDQVLQFEAVGEIGLRGKADAAGLVSVERAGAIDHQESERALASDGVDGRRPLQSLLRGCS